MKWTEELLREVVKDALRQDTSRGKLIDIVIAHIKDIVRTDGLSLMEMHNLASKLWYFLKMGAEHYHSNNDPSAIAARYNDLLGKYNQLESLSCSVNQKNEYLTAQLKAANDAVEKLSIQLNEFEEEISKLKQTQSTGPDIAHWSERISDLCESLFSDNNTAKKFLTMEAMKKVMSEDQIDAVEIIKINMQLLLTVGYLLMNQNKQYIPTILQEQLQMQLDALSQNLGNCVATNTNRGNKCVTREEVLDYIVRHKFAAFQQILDLLGGTKHGIRYHLARLMKEKKIVSLHLGNSAAYMSAEYAKERDTLLAQPNAIPLMDGSVCHIDFDTLGVISKKSVSEIFKRTLLNKYYGKIYADIGTLPLANIAEFILRHLDNSGFLRIDAPCSSRKLNYVTDHLKKCVRSITENRCTVLFIPLTERCGTLKMPEGSRKSVIFVICHIDTYQKWQKLLIPIHTIEAIRRSSHDTVCTTLTKFGDMFTDTPGRSVSWVYSLRDRGVIDITRPENSSACEFRFTKAFKSRLPAFYGMIDTAKNLEAVKFEALLEAAN